VRQSEKFEDKRDAEKLSGEKSEVCVCFLQKHLCYTSMYITIHCSLVRPREDCRVRRDAMTKEEQQAELQQ